MNNQALKEVLDKIPIFPLAFLYVGFLGYGYYQFINDPGSSLNMKKQEISSTLSEIDALQAKIKKVNDFAKTLELKKLQLRQLAQDLDSMKSGLPETLDIPDMMKTMLTEARRAGLTVISLRPGNVKTGDYYREQDLEFASTGVFFQYLIFLDRVANLEKIVRVENFDFAPMSPSNAKYVQLKSTIQFKAYSYVGSKADEVGKAAKSSASIGSVGGSGL